MFQWTERQRGKSGLDVERQRPPAHAAQSHDHKGQTSAPCMETSGTVVAMRRVPGFRVVENHYPAGLELPRHLHEHAYLSYVLDGPYAESYGDRPA